MSAQGGGAFNWSTNLPQVAQVIQRELQRIQSSTKAMSSGTTGAQFLQGFEARIAAVARSMQTQMATVAADFERQMRRQAAAGGGVTGRDPSGRTITQATRPAINQALEQIQQLTNQVTHALPQEMAPLRQQLQRQLQTASSTLVGQYRESMQVMSRDLAAMGREIGGVRGRGPFQVAPQPGGRTLDVQAQRAISPAEALDPRQVRQMQAAMNSLTQAGQRISNQAHQAQRQVQEMASDTARRVARDLRQERMGARRDPGGAARIQVPGVGPVWFDQRGTPHVRSRDPETGEMLGARELDRRELDPLDREALEQRRAVQQERVMREQHTEALRENERRVREQSRATYDNVQQQLRQRQAMAVGGGRTAVVQTASGQMAQVDRRAREARILSGQEEIAARRRVNREIESIQGQANRENVRRERQAQERRQQALIEGERNTYRRLTGELERGAAMRSRAGAGRVVRDAGGGLFDIDPRQQRARLLQGQEAVAANVQMEQELNRRSKALADQRGEAARAQQRQTRAWLGQEARAGRARRAGVFMEHQPTQQRFRLERGGREARRITDTAEMAEAESRLAQARRRAVTDMRRRTPVMDPMAAGAAGGGGGRIDRTLQAMAGGGEGGGRGLRGGDILGSMMQYSRYFIASGAIIGVVTALRAAKEAAVDYRESLTDLEVALGETGRASAPFISSLSDIARFAGANTGEAIDSAVRGVRAFVQSTPDSESMSWGPIEFLGFDDSAYQQDAERVGTQVAETAQRLAVIAEKELGDATGDIISIASGFSLDEAGASTEAGFNRITDAVAVAKRQIGGDASEIAQGLSSLASVASEAGFTLEESANLISLVQARTDQSGRAVATRLSRVFSIIGGSAGRSAIEQLNMQLEPSVRVDTTGSVRDQLMEISNLYSSLSQQQQNMVRNALGGTANVKELVPILQNPEELAEALDAQFENVGAGTEEFDRKARDLAGTIRRLSGDIKGLVTGLFEAGVGDVFLIALQGLEPFTNALRQLINVYNRLFDMLNAVNIAGRGFGDWMQTAIMLMAQWKAATFLFGRAAEAGLVTPMRRGSMAARAVPPRHPAHARGTDQFRRPASDVLAQGVGLAASMLFMGRGGGNRVSRRMRGVQDPIGGSRDEALGWLAALSGRGGGARGGLDQISDLDMEGFQQDFAESVSFANARFATLSAAISNMGDTTKRAVRGMRNFINANPLLVIAGGVLAISKAWDASHAALEGMNAGFESLSETMPQASGAELRDFAQNLASASEETRQAVGGVFGWMTDALTGFQGRAAGDMLETRAARVRSFGQQFEERQRDVARAQVDPADAIRLETAESVSESLDILDQEGRGARTRMDALASAMRKMADEAGRAQRTLGELDMVQFAFDLGDALRSELATETNLRRSRTAEGPGLTGGNWRDIGHENRQLDDLQDLLSNEPFQERMDDAIQQWVQASGGELSPESREDLTNFIQQRYLDQLERDGKEIGEKHREATQAAAKMAVINTVRDWENVEDPFDLIQAAMAAIDLSSAAKEEDATKMRAGRMASRRGASVDSAERRIRDLEQARADAVRTARELGIDPTHTLEQLDHAIIEAELEAVEARRARVQRLMELERSTLSSGAEVQRLDAEIGALETELRMTSDREQEEELRTRLNELEQQRARAYTSRAESERRAGIDPRDTVGLAREETRATQMMMNLVASFEGGEESQEYWDLVAQLQQNKIDEARTELELSQARRRSGVSPRDAIAQAVNAVRDARENLDIEIEGTQAYYEAELTYRERLIELTEARTKLAGMWRLARVDPRDSLGQINAELDNALDEYNDAIRHDDSEGQAQAFREIRQLQQRRADELRAVGQAERRAAIDPRDQRALIVAEYRSAAEDYQASLAGTQDRAAAREAMRKAQVDLAQHDRDYAAAARSASVDPSSQTERARVDLQNAAENLRGQIRGTIAWQQAYGEWRQAQVALAEAVLSEQSLMRQLSIDLTDPVATAREELQAARERLAAARQRGAPRDVLAQREIDVRNAEAQAEQAAFQQRLSDVQHANDMGRMSHAAYISYLEEEAGRLRSISDRTRQQQEQLQTVEKALKAAKDEMEGQFNLGDIRMPTPYEVRRSIAAQAAGIQPALAAQGQAVAVTQGSQTTVENTILVNGADTAEVTRILNQILGPNAMSRSTPGSSGTRRM